MIWWNLKTLESFNWVVGIRRGIVQPFERFLSESQGLQAWDIILVLHRKPQCWTVFVCFGNCTCMFRSKVTNRLYFGNLLFRITRAGKIQQELTLPTIWQTLKLNSPVRLSYAHSHARSLTSWVLFWWERVRVFFRACVRESKRGGQRLNRDPRCERPLRVARRNVDDVVAWERCWRFFWALLVGFFFASNVATPWVEGNGFFAIVVVSLWFRFRKDNNNN